MSPLLAFAADCWADRTGSDPVPEHYVGVRYKALLVEQSLPTNWMLLFNGCGFTSKGEYQPHFFDMMIKAGKMAAIYKDGLCPFVGHDVRDAFGFEFGVSDYEDPGLKDNDIGLWSQDPLLFPRTFSNIDTSDPAAADKAEAEYQIDRGGLLTGKEIQISFERGKTTKLPPQKNYFMDADNGGKPNSQADILYRQWMANFKVPALKVDSTVEVYVNAAQAEFIRGNHTMNVMWENPGRAPIETEKFKVIMFDFEVKREHGRWIPVKQFLVDFRSPKADLPYNKDGALVGGYRRVMHQGKAALEASYGYGYTDYVKDGDPTATEPTSKTMGVIKLAR